MNHRERIRNFIKEHTAALVCALFVGVLAVLPQFVFIASLGGEYRGIPMMQTPNEAAYMGIMQEVADGHPLAASVSFFEYKDALPLLPPTLAAPYAWAAKLFSASIVNVVLAGKFFLPALLFLLVYLFTLRLVGERTGRAKLQALTAASLVVLGFDLVDYRSLFDYLSGVRAPANFLIWTRPVNPISGAILLFIFLISLSEIQRAPTRKWILRGGLSLALMMASYVFSWTLALAALGVLALFALIMKRRELLLPYFGVLAVGFTAALPYFFLVWQASKSLFYADASSRIGLFHTHAPHFNKFVVASLLLFLLLSLWHWRKKRQNVAEPWWLFSFALLCASFIAYNQQVITGTEIWYYHYVFYTIPFCFVALSLSLWHFIRPHFPKVWMTLILLILSASVLLGAYTQVAPYRETYAYYKHAQSYADLAHVLNTEAEKDCVVFVVPLDPPLDTFVPAFTHCNMYISGERNLLAPQERFTHNYLSWLRIRGIEGAEIENYLAEHRSEAFDYLFFQNRASLGHPDVQFEKLFAELPELYRAFLKKDLRSELLKYRIDYILADETLPEQVRKELDLGAPVFKQSALSLYEF